MSSKSGKLTLPYKHLICAILIGLCAVYQHFSFNTYSDSDNYMISIILNGIYGNNNICNYVSPILSVAVKALAKVFPAADCFALLCWIFMMAAAYASFLFVLEKLPGTPKKAVGILIVFQLIFVFCGGIFCNYTVQTAFISAVGWLYLLLEIKSGQIRKGRVVFAAVMLGFGFMLRSKAAFLMLPFAVLVSAAELFEPLLKGEKPAYKKYIVSFGSVLAGITVLILVQNAVLYSPEYRSSAEYDAVRIRIGDFPLLPYDQNRLDGISENDYNSLREWIFMDTDIVTTEYMEKIAESSCSDFFGGRERDGQLLVKTVLSMFVWIFVILNYFFLFLLLETVTNGKLSTVKKLAVVFAYAGAGIILFYFYFSGRLPERVSISIALGVILTRCALTDEKSERTVTEKKRPFHTAVFVLLSVFSLVNCVRAVSEAEYRPRPSFMAAKSADKEQSPDSEIYIWPPGGFWSNLPESGRLPTQEYLRHNISVGGWEYGHKCFKSFLSDIQVENPMKALLYRENTYYIDEENSSLKEHILEWLREHYDENVQAEIVDKRDDCDIWKFILTGKNQTENKA